jgi:signal transduction histidine kinase
MFEPTLSYPMLPTELYSRISDAVLVESESRLVYFANEAFCNLFRIKITPHKLQGLHTINSGMLASFVVKNPSKFLNRIDELIEQKTVVHNETILLKDGHIVERDFIPITLHNNTPAYLWIYKKQATNLTAALAFTENEVIKAANNTSTVFTNNSLVFEQLLLQFPIALSIVNSNNEYIFINEAYLPNTAKRNYLLGKTDVQFAHYYNLATDKALQHQSHVQQAVEQKKIISIEEEDKIANSHIQFLQTHFFPFTVADTTTYVAKYSVNITALKQQQQSLHQTLQLYQQIVNKVNNLVLVANNKLEPNFINTTWQQQLIQPLATEAVENIFNTISLTNYKFYKQVFELLSGDADAYEGRIQLQHNNKNRWYNYNLETTPNHLNEKNLVAILNDITNEVVLEENLLEVVKREKELNDLKSAFVNMVSHELRTPLAVIASGAEIIGLMLQAGKPTDNIQPYIQQITDEVERMTTFMNDLLMVSKIEAGKVEFTAIPTSLNSFVEQLVQKQFAPYKDGRHATLLIKGNKKDVAIDEKMMRHVLQNLLDNAFKYSLHQPAPTVRIRYGKRFATISIVDHGIGIHADDVPKLFTSFSRGRNVADIAGTGIGLVVVKYFVELHKGQLFIKSKEGKGSIFSIKIPYQHG